MSQTQPPGAGNMPKVLSGANVSFLNSNSAGSAETNGGANSSIRAASSERHQGGDRIDTKQVLVLLTGGTAGMRRDSVNGSLAPEKGYLAESLRHSLNDTRSSYKYPQITVLEYGNQLDSSDMGGEEWCMIARDVERYYNQYDGFVIVMGTDTMSYCASALSFMLSNLGKTVAVTGAMLPIERGESDARRNLVMAIIVAAVSRIPEVVIVFRDYVFRGNRTTKFDTDSLNAFTSPNFPPLAILGTELIIQRSLVLNPPPSYGLLDVHDKIDPNIIAVKLIPGMRLDYIVNIAGLPDLKGLILELYGAGNAPKTLDVSNAVQKAVQRGVIVVIVSQCIKGDVDLRAYSSGRRMLEAGAISAGDMTVEACAIKLGFLFGEGYSPQKVKAMMSQNLRGELSPGAKTEARFLNCIVVKDVDHLASNM